MESLNMLQLYVNPSKTYKFMNLRQDPCWKQYKILLTCCIDQINVPSAHKKKCDKEIFIHVTDYISNKLTAT